MEIRTIIGLIGIGLIVGPIIPSMIQVIILYYQMVHHTISATDYQSRLIPLITDLLTPTEYSIYAIFGKFGTYVVGAILFLYWFLTGQFGRNK